MSQPKHAAPSGPMRGHGPGGRMMTGEKAKNFKGSTRKLLSYLKPFHWAIIMVLLCAAISTVFTIVGPKVLAKATDELAKGIMAVITGGDGVIDFGYIGVVLLTLLGLYLLSALFSYVQGFTMAGISAKVSYNLRQQIIQKINRLPLGYFHKVSQGEILSRITNDVDTLSQSLNQSVTQLITSVTSMIGVLIMMLSISWQLTLVALCILPLSLLLVMGVVKKSQGYFRGQQKYLGAVNGHVEEMYGGHLVVKAFNGEEKSVKAFDEQNKKLYNAGWKAQFLSGLMQPIMGFVGNLGYVAICILGASMAAGGTMTIGGIQAFIQYVRSFTQPITQMANISNQLQMTVAAAERVFEFLEEKEEAVIKPRLSLAHRSEEPSAEKIRLKGDVQFSHVRFGYEPDEVIIKDFSADVKAGQKVAIVGPTGAGKTTLVKLLMRFHDIDAGEFLHGLPIFFHRIPFVDRDDASLSLLMSISRHFGILFRKALGRINDNHAYIRAIHRHIGAQHRIFFDCFFHFCFAANASRIDKHKLAIFIFHKGIRGIPGRSCNIGNDYPLFTRHSVNQ